MSGFKHTWNGTILTITSDSGTSSADLKGDLGPRGPQGPAGVVASLSEEERELLRGPAGPAGDDYVLTIDDKNEIATIVKGVIFTFDPTTGRLDITV
jgi:hypothetical protein